VFTVCAAGVQVADAAAERVRRQASGPRAHAGRTGARAQQDGQVERGQVLHARQTQARRAVQGEESN